MNMHDIPGLRLPPHSTEYEQAVLGGLLTDPTRIDDLGLEVSDFYHQENLLTFQAIRDCLEVGQCDILMVAERLQANNTLGAVGGVPYLVSLRDACASTASLGAYAKQVKSKSGERALLEASNQIAGIVDGAGDFESKLAQSQSVLLGLESGQATGEVKTVREALTAMIERVDATFHGKVESRKTGFVDLDRMIVGLEPGDMVVVAGRPSMGKTSLALQIARNVSETDPALIFSLEMPATQLAMRQAASVSGVDVMKLRTAKLTDEDWGRLTYAVGKLHDKNILIDDRSGMTMHQIRARARSVKRKHGLGLIVIDYIGLIHGEGENRVNVVSEISRQIKSMARELNVPVIALSQLSRKVEERTNKRPVMSDLRDSGSIEQDADLVLLLYRDEYYNPDTSWKGVAECIIGKQRNGPIGMVPLTFIADRAMFADFSGRYAPDAQTKRGRGFEE